MMRDLVDLVNGWWKRDRIRVRPSEGRLFRLRPGAVLCFSDSPHTPPINAEVVARRDDQDARCPTICYFCRTSRGEGELIVTYRGAGGPAIDWFADGALFELQADDIEVFYSDSRKFLFCQPKVV
jgi:hypothetical protein